MAVSNLEELERWMQSAICGELVEPAGIVLPSSQMTANERLAIYQRAYLARLVECMRAEFPMCCRALGEVLFDAIAMEYLSKHPPTSYTLAELGRLFPHFLAANAPADLPARAALVDLARLEWATNEVFSAEGTEHDPPLDLSQLDPDRWESLKLQLAPCIRLLELRTAAHEYYRMLRSNSTTVPPEETTAWLIVSRFNFTVRHHAVGEPQFALLTAIQNGATLAAAIAAASTVSQDDLGQFAARLHGWFTWFAAERLLQLAPQGIAPLKP